MRKLVILAAAGAAAVGIAVPLALASASASTVKVTEKEFKITPSASSAPAGKVTFKIKNAGALDHTFDVIKTSLPASKLPVKKDRVTLKPLATSGPFKPGKTGTLSLTLKAGKYVLICNVSGHYKAGQRIAFTVK
jgi:uncharacterized cupredoxin-like copper-binding protein